MVRFNFDFQNRIFDSLFGGASVLELPRLDVNTLEEAYDFAKAYGFDLSKEEDTRLAWDIHQKAISLIRDRFLEKEEKIPEILADQDQLKDVAYLLVYASTQEHEQNHIQRWSCAVLRVMHVFFHLRNDLFSAFSYEIQDQVFRPFQDCVITDKEGKVWLKAEEGQGIELFKFDVKSFKTTRSSVIKLLAKPEMFALTLFDKLGMRFVTKSVFDCFRVVRFLVENHLISFPHVMPDQSINTLYPTNLFLEEMERLQSQDQLPRAEEIEEILDQRLNDIESEGGAQYTERYNRYSAENYRFIKFITRQLIKVPLKTSEEGEDFSFFYPYEIQIMDHETYLSNMSGPSAHDKYKERQRMAARARVMGTDLELKE